jgi:PelA/Pel-15E family pectate lyase
MAVLLTDKGKTDLIAQKKTDDATIDNDGTYTQLIFLARMFKATQDTRYEDAFFKGLDFLLAAQYENGGWPQFYPHPLGYQKHITFNDDAMVGVLNLMREIAHRGPAYSFVDEQRRGRAERAVTKGVDCILKCQIRINGKRTAWCAQHDERTFAPASARTYEKISLSGGESVGIVRFLMGIEHPNRPVIDAIQSAVSWLDQVKLLGISVVDKRDAAQPRGFDRVVVDDPKAEPLWARFYEIGTNRPIFCGRDGVIKYTFAEIEYERRTGYRWYLNTPAKLLATDYPAWAKQHGLEKR